MGCDSHLAIEILEIYTSIQRWETYALDLPQSRDYSMFAAMAGVRGRPEDAVVPPRGIPADASQSVVYWFKRTGEHTPSWLYPEEFHKVIEQITDSVQYELAKEWRAVDAILINLAKIYGDKNVRLVFFFDS